MNKNLFYPDKELAGLYRKAYLKNNFKGIEKTVVGQFILSPSFMSPFKTFRNMSKNSFGIYLSKNLKNCLEHFGSRGNHIVSSEECFNPSFIKQLSYHIEIKNTEDDFYKMLHKKVFSHVKEGGQISDLIKLGIDESGKEINILIV